MTHPHKIVIVGEGAWGSALKTLWAPQFKTHQSLHSQSTEADWSQALKDKPVVVLACPFKVVPSIMSRFETRNIHLVINASKGIDPKSLKTFQASIRPSLRQRIPLLSLSGPTFAQEILEGKPAAAVLAAKNLVLASRWAKFLSSPQLRLYSSRDPLGIEACGALKNVIAIACGLSDGLGLGLNARAALLTRSLRELQILCHHLGGRSETVFGLAGVGDLWLTATGDLSRNRQVGLALARGLSAEEAQKKIGTTCEGLFTVVQVMKIAKRAKLDLPISREVYAVCYQRKDPQKSLRDLMKRALKNEETIVHKANQK